MRNKITLFKNKNSLDNLLFFFFCIYPISFLLGNFSINLFLFIFNILLALGVSKKYYDLKSISKPILLALCFLFLFFLTNLIFSNNFQLTYPRILKFILIIGFIISFRQLIISFDETKIIKLYKIWSLIFLVVLLDITFELIFKSNIFGFKSFMPGRIASFSGAELNIGHFFSAFSLIFLSFIHSKYKSISLNLSLSIILITISFMIGERSNFIKTLIIISTFIFLVYKINIQYKILSISSLIVFFIIFLNINSSYKHRYFYQFTNILSTDGISSYLDNTIYGAHYNVAKEIFKDNKFFGVGIKNFRIESYSKKYDNLEHKQNDRRANTHPHQIHYEFLAETGLVGYLSFTIFIIFSIYLAIKSYINNKILFQLSGIFYVVVSLLPLLPSGSFFSTYTSSLFWLNYAIMVGYIKNHTKS